MNPSNSFMPRVILSNRLNISYNYIHIVGPREDMGALGPEYPIESECVADIYAIWVCISATTTWATMVYLGFYFQEKIKLSGKYSS